MLGMFRMKDDRASKTGELLLHVGRLSSRILYNGPWLIPVYQPHHSLIEVVSAGYGIRARPGTAS